MLLLFHGASRSMVHLKLKPQIWLPETANHPPIHRTAAQLQPG